MTSSEIKTDICRWITLRTPFSWSDLPNYDVWVAALIHLSKEYGVEQKINGRTKALRSV